MILRWCLLQLWWIMNNDLLSRGVDGGHIRTTRATDDTKCKRHFSISSPAVMMSAWPQPAPSSDWSKESFWRRGETLGPFHTCAHFCGGALANQSTHTHTHTHTHTGEWHGGSVPRGISHSNGGAADSQAKAHLMPSHLPSVCWIIPLACSTTGTSLNTPVKYKNAQSKTRSYTHTHTQKERKKKGLQLQTAGRDMCLSGWVTAEGTGGGFSTSQRQQRRSWLIREHIFSDNGLGRNWLLLQWGSGWANQLIVKNCTEAHGNTHLLILFFPALPHTRERLHRDVFRVRHSQQRKTKKPAFSTRGWWLYSQTCLALSIQEGELSSV